MSRPRHGDPPPLGDAELPYSKGLMARALIAVGVAADRAYSLARRIEVDLAQRRERTVDLARLDELARETLGEHEGERAVERLRRLADLQALDVPLIVLIGGSTGTGKSTVAAEVAHRLGITRVTSTDFIRQTMRAFFSEEFMPTIHRSSFEAGEAMVGEVKGDPTVAGFVEQSRLVRVGVDAAIRRALTEGWSIVLEGVHLVPGLVPEELEGALVVHVIVAIPDEQTHRMPLPRPGHRNGRVPPDGQVPRPPRRDPDSPDASRRAGDQGRHPGGRERERRADDRRGRRARAARRRPGAPDRRRARLG